MTWQDWPCMSIHVELDNAALLTYSHVEPNASDQV